MLSVSVAQTSFSGIVIHIVFQFCRLRHVFTYWPFRMRWVFLSSDRTNNHNSQDFSQILLGDCELHSGSKVCYLQIPCCCHGSTRCVRTSTSLKAVRASLVTSCLVVPGQTVRRRLRRRRLSLGQIWRTSRRVYVKVSPRSPADSPPLPAESWAPFRFVPTFSISILSALAWPSSLLVFTH